MKLPTLPHDKALHVVYGYAVAVASVLLLFAVLLLAAWPPGMPWPVQPWLVALLGPFVVGGLKELRDRRTRRGTASRWDWFATSAAGAPLALLLWLLH
jgi:hypothetical protein